MIWLGVSCAVRFRRRSGRNDLKTFTLMKLDFLISFALIADLVRATDFHSSPSTVESISW